VHLNTSETKTGVLIFYVTTIFTEILVDSWSYIYSDNSALRCSILLKVVQLLKFIQSTTGISKLDGHLAVLKVELWHLIFLCPVLPSVL